MLPLRQLELDALLDSVGIVGGYDDEQVDVPEYWITSYGIDYDVAGLVRRLHNGDIESPTFQRGLVWKISRASRFIESLLLKLPVPGIFLYKEADSQKQLVIDGKQRLLTLRGFYDGEFADKKFKLTGLISQYNGKAYNDLTDADRRKLDDSVIHATVIRQDKPDDGGSSQYAIFERLNSESTPLTAQEIRAAIYPGAFNELLSELNDNAEWRELFGSKHNRRRDEELILRFFALFFDHKNYRRPMKGFLNNFMSKNRDLDELTGKQLREIFDNTVSFIHAELGQMAFRPNRFVNGALCDAVMVGIARSLKTNQFPSNAESAYRNLVNDNRFLELLSVRTSSKEIVLRRLDMATSAFKLAR